MGLVCFVLLKSVLSQFISPPPSRVYYSTVFGVFQDTRGEIRLREAQHHAEGVHIINSEGIAYHQHEVLYIIKPQENTRWRVMRYSPEGLMIYTARCAVMICQGKRLG